MPACMLGGARRLRQQQQLLLLLAVALLAAAPAAARDAPLPPQQGPTCPERTQCTCAFESPSKGACSNRLIDAVEGGSTERIHMAFEFGQPFVQGAAKDGIRVTLTVNPEDDSGTEDIEGVMFTVNPAFASLIDPSKLVITAMANGLDLPTTYTMGRGRVAFDAPESTCYGQCNSNHPDTFQAFGCPCGLGSHIDNSGACVLPHYDAAVRVGDPGSARGSTKQLSFVLSTPGEHLGPELLYGSSWFVRVASTDLNSTAGTTGSAKMLGSVSCAAIDVEEQVSVDGGRTWADADVAPGPSLLQGHQEDLQLRYVVSNRGSVPLDGVALSDSDPVVRVALGDKGVIGTLAAGVSTTVTVSGAAAAAAWAVGQHAGVATAAGSYANDQVDGAPVDGAARSVSDADKAHFYGAVAGIDVQARISVDGGATWIDAATAADGPALLRPASDSPVPFKFVVTNTGNVPLAGVTVLDDKMGAIGAIGTLAVGRRKTFTKSLPWAAGQHVNTVTARGSYADGAGNTPAATREATAHYLGATPAISVKTFVSADGGATWEDAGASAGSAPALLQPSDGGLVAFKFVVTNTGDVPLADVMLSSTRVPLGTDGAIDTLAVGASHTVTKLRPWAAGLHESKASAYASFTDVTGATSWTTDSVVARYLGASPALKLAKRVKDAAGAFQDANAEPYPRLPRGSAPQYQFVVTNVGDVTLSGVSVTDEAVPTGLVGSVATLAPGESQTLTAEGTYSPGIVVSSATASATFAGATISASDAAGFEGELLPSPHVIEV